MSKGKVIQPLGTAADRIAQQQAQQPQQQNAGVNPVRKDFNQLSQFEQDLVRKTQEAAQTNSLQGGFVSADAVPRVEQNEDEDDRIIFKVRVGKKELIIEMAPPSVPHVLVIPGMFKGIAITLDNALEIDARMRTATIMQYVRSINDMELPNPIYRWEEVVSWMHKLGDIGCRAVWDNYALHWPDQGGALWEPVKSTSRK